MNRVLLLIGLFILTPSMMYLFIRGLQMKKLGT